MKLFVEKLRGVSYLAEPMKRDGFFHERERTLLVRGWFYILP